MEEARFTTCYYSLSLKDIDSQYMIFTAEIKPIEYACQPYEVIVYDNKNQKILHTSPNLMNDTYEYYSAKINGVRAFTKYDNMLYHKSFYNDTLYSIHKEKGINPFAVIDLNDSKLPNEVFLSRDEYFKKFGKILINGIYINQNCILLECYSLKESGNSEGFICKCDIASEKLTYHQLGLVNDIDGGTNVHLLKELTDNIVYVYPSNEIEEKNKKYSFSTLDNSELKHPELRDNFESIQKNRKTDDNPLLMILYIK